MSFTKSVQVGPVAVTVSEESGQLKLSASAGGSLGGGSAAGVLQAKIGGEIDVSDKQALELMKALADARFPKLAPLIDEAVAAAETVL